uniref:Uncharacterized protein n=1 Tax=Zea mays TaxID=4577 RepID=A0A804MGL8_MAIZE
MSARTYTQAKTLHRRPRQSSLLADQASAGLAAAAERVGRLLHGDAAHGPVVLASEPPDLAAGVEDAAVHLEPSGAAHDGDPGARVHPGGADVARAVGLAQHAVHVGAEGVELERHVEVREAAVPGAQAVAVDPRVLGGHRHGVGHGPEPPVQAHHHAVGGARAEHGQRGRRRGAPAGAGHGVQRHGHPVEGDGQPVLGVVPDGRPPDAQVQPVPAEPDAQRLHPREVPRRRGGARVVALADEVRVDVQVGVRHQAEVGVAPAVEQELVAVASHEARVVALRAGQLAHCSIKIFEQDYIYTWVM